MRAWKAIQSSADYIENHLTQPLSIKKLANLAALSPFYFQRLFSRLTGKPVREYIKLRRLSRAGALLKTTGRRILDIVLDCGFESHEQFSRSFKTAYGITPAEYREHPVPLNQFDKPDLLLRYALADEGVPRVSDGLVLERNRRMLDKPLCFAGISGFVPIAGQIPPGASTGVDIPGRLWKEFHKKKTLLDKAPNGREIGVAYPGDAPEGFFTYFVGAEVSKGRLLEGFELYELSAREYLICSFEAETFEEPVTTALNKAIGYSGLWMRRHGLTCLNFAPELYHGQTKESAAMELWYPVGNTQ